MKPTSICNSRVRQRGSMLGRTLTGLQAIGVVIAGGVVWPITPSPSTWIHRLRWLIAVLTTYGAISFIYAAVSGATVGETLSGRPGWFQAVALTTCVVMLTGTILLPTARLVQDSGIARGRQAIRNG